MSRVLQNKPVGVLFFRAGGDRVEENERLSRKAPTAEELREGLLFAERWIRSTRPSEGLSWAELTYVTAKNPTETSYASWRSLRGGSWGLVPGCRLAREGSVAAVVSDRREEIRREGMRGGGGARAKADAVQIVLVWVTEDTRVMWLNRGTEADVAKARAYAKAESDSDKTIHVFVYPMSVKDPLGAARKDVLRT